MFYFGIAMHRISLATLIISLGLLVDNGIVVAEEIGKRLFQGEERLEAAINTGRGLAMPLLTSSITTVLMFVPLALAPHSSGEYLRSMAQVIMIALGVSWLLAMTVTPILCARFLKPPQVSEEAAAVTEKEEITVVETAEVEEEAQVPVVVDPGRELNIYMVQHALCAWDAFWCVVEKGIEEAAKQMNVNVTVLGPDEFDLEKTAQLIDQAVAAQPDGIGVTVTDPDLFREPIQRALDAGIPVVGYNAGQGPIEDGIDYMTYLGQDEYAGGYLG